MTDCQCSGRGLIRIRYATGEPDDIAMCSCREGQWWRSRGASLIRPYLHLSPEQRVAWLEDFNDQPGTVLDYKAAGVAKRRPTGRL